MKSYIVSAVYNYFYDQKKTILVRINCLDSRVRVPVKYIGADGTIVLNMTSKSIVNLVMEPAKSKLITFNASFCGVSYSIVIPFDSVIRIYCPETHEKYNFPMRFCEAKIPPLTKKSDSHGKVVPFRKKSDSHGLPDGAA